MVKVVERVVEVVETVIEVVERVVCVAVRDVRNGKLVELVLVCESVVERVSEQEVVQLL